MVINIPLQIDDKMIEGKLQEEYEKKVAEKISELVMSSLAEAGDTWGVYGQEEKAERGVIKLTERKIDSYFEEHKEEIYDAIVKKLWDRAKNRKILRDTANNVAEGGLNEA